VKTVVEKGITPISTIDMPIMLSEPTTITDQMNQPVVNAERNTTVEKQTPIAISEKKTDNEQKVTTSQPLKRKENSQISSLHPKTEPAKTENHTMSQSSNDVKNTMTQKVETPLSRTQAKQASTQENNNISNKKIQNKIQERSVAKSIMEEMVYIAKNMSEGTEKIVNKIKNNMEHPRSNNEQLTPALSAKDSKKHFLALNKMSREKAMSRDEATTNRIQQQLSDDSVYVNKQLKSNILKNSITKALSSDKAFVSALTFPNEVTLMTDSQLKTFAYNLKNGSTLSQSMETAKKFSKSSDIQKKTIQIEGNNNEQVLMGVKVNKRLEKPEAQQVQSDGFEHLESKDLVKLIKKLHLRSNVNE
jgi:hypothetical protein